MSYPARALHRFIVVFPVVAALLGGSCVPPVSQPPATSTDTLDLSSANAQTLTQLGERFAALAASGSAPQATAALLAELQAGQAGVTSAVLGADGCTLYLTLSDGSPALFNTNTAAFGAGGTSASAAARRQAERARGGNRRAFPWPTARTISASSACAGQITPALRKTLIVNAAAVSHPSTAGYVQEIRDALISRGWQPGDIDLRTRLDADDSTFTPDSLLGLSGYGLVFIIARDCQANPGDGVQHTYLQCCKAGNFADVLGPERWLLILGEKNGGRLIRGHTATESGGFVSDIYVRDDFLLEQINVDPQALVYFIAGNTSAIADGVGGGGAGSALGWVGSCAGKDGQLTVLGLLRLMTAAGAWTTDEAAFAELPALGLGTSQGFNGEMSFASLVAIPEDFFLPAWGSFSTDPAELPQDAVQAQVSVRYAECPDGGLDFTMASADTVDAEFLPAGEAT